MQLRTRTFPMSTTSNTKKEVLSALSGAAITLILQLLFLIRAGAPLVWQPLVLAAVTGAVIGWFYRLMTSLRTVAEAAVTRLAHASQTFEFCEQPRAMLIRADAHFKTLAELLSDSMKEKYRYISYI